MYVFVARIWSIVFAAVGLLFVFFPITLGEQLNAAGNVLGLSGRVISQPGTLWYYLTLSLMGLITLLSWYSASNPENKMLCRMLVTAKFISVFGFLFAAITIGSVWFLPAFADLFVAATLIVSHQFLHDTNEYFVRQFNRKQKKFSEVWYGKIDIDEDIAFWFRYTLLQGKEQTAHTWAIFFDKGKIQTGKNTWPCKALAPGNIVILPESNDLQRFYNKRQVFHIGNQHLDEGNAIGSSGIISWDLQFNSSGLSHRHKPKLLHLLGITKSTYDSCFIDLRYSGSVTVDGKTYTFQQKTGNIGHIYGTQSAYSWSWAHCNHFSNAEGVVFEGISARLKKGGKITSPMSSFVLFENGVKNSFTTMKSLTKSFSDIQNNVWEFKTENSRYKLTGRADLLSPALVEYTDTDGSKLWCYNSKLSNLMLQLTDKKTGQTKSFEAAKTAAFEIVTRDAPSRQLDL